MISVRRWRRRARPASPGGPPTDNEWIRYCTEDHLRLLMSIMERSEAGEPLDDDPYYLSEIKTQAEKVMALAIQCGADKLPPYDLGVWLESWTIGPRAV